MCDIELVFDRAGHMNGPVTRNVPPAPLLIKLGKNRYRGVFGIILTPPAPDPALNLPKRKGSEMQLFRNAPLSAKRGDLCATAFRIKAKAVKGTLDPTFKDRPFCQRGAQVWAAILGHQQRVNV